MSCMVQTKGLENFGRKFGNTFVRTILMEPHVSLSPYQVDGEQLIGRQISLLGSWLKLKPKSKCYDWPNEGINYIAMMS